jgi:hypothetical protein
MQIVSQLVLNENNIAFHPVVGNSYQLSDSGARIVNLLKQHKTKNEIIEILAKEYGVNKNEIFIDVSDFIAKLRVYGLYQ